MHRLRANQPWFTFSAAAAEYAVYAFTGTERINEPFEFTIHFVSKNRNLPTAALLGMEGTLTITDKSRESRFVHGIISQIRQLHTGNRFTHYQCLLVPRLRFLQEAVNHRMYQIKGVPQILDDILRKQQFPPESYALRLAWPYLPRNYCTQYGESDYHFLCRLCEEEGIAFSFEHTKDRHCLVFTDTAGGPPITGDASIRFSPGSGNVADTPVISRITHQQRINGNAAVYRDWNAMNPAGDLEVSASDGNSTPTPAGMNLETYRFPHIYREREEGERYAEIQLARQLAFREWLEGTTDVSRMTPGRVFSMHEHPRAELNRQWWLYEVVHKGEQPGVLEREAPGNKGQRYTATFVAIPAQTHFVPEIRHEKRRIAGVQSALVVGPAGEEIFTDENGRVKVSFFWDRRNREDETASCWIRVAQGWSGNGFGTLALPRVGSEVLVSFEEGDPDRPIITGRAYHAEMGLPCDLPSGKTATVLRSSSSPGGGGFNELRIEDKKGKEEIYVRAEKDMALYTGNDWADYVRHDRHSTVDANLYLNVQGETHEHHKKIRKTEVAADDHLTVHANRHEKIKGKWLNSTGSEVHVKAGVKIVLEAGTELTLKAGSNFIKIDPLGVHIKGTTIGLNSGGSPGMGSPAAPQLPELAANMLADRMHAEQQDKRARETTVSVGKQGSTDRQANSSAAGANTQEGAKMQHSLLSAHTAAQPLASNCTTPPAVKNGGKQ